LVEPPRQLYPSIVGLCSFSLKMPPLQVTGHVEDNRLEGRSMTRADGRTVVLRGETRGDGQHGEEADAIGHDD
jgi:hypothetical protein